MAVVCFKSQSKHQALFALICFSFIIAVTDGCTYDFDCDIEMNQVCCNSECVYGSSCIGRYCTSDANCSIDKSCCKSECTSDDCLGSSCSNDTDCNFLKVAVTELANTQMKNVMNHLVLANLQPLLFAQ